MILRQSTVVAFLVGPILDADGAAVTTGPVIGDIRLTKNGTVSAAAAAATLVHDHEGMWKYTAIAGNIDTVGRLQVSLNDTPNAMKPVEFQVVEEAVYDAMYAASAAGPLQSTTAGRKLTVSANGEGNADLTFIHGTALTETATQLAGAFVQFFDVATPTGTVNSLPNAAADAAGGLPISDAGGLDMDNLATKDDVAGIANVGAATAEPTVAAPGGFTLTTGTNEQNDEDSTHAPDGTEHQWDSTGNAMEGRYLFDIGGAFSPAAAGLSLLGRLNGANGDEVLIRVNTGTIASPVWNTRGVLARQPGSTSLSHTFTFFASDVMTGADAGKVQVQIINNGTVTGATFSVDQMFVSKTSIADVTGYSGGAIWYDDTASRETTVPDVDGTARHPVSTWAAVKSLISSTGLRKVEIANGSAVALDANSDTYTLLGREWSLNLGTGGGQSIEGLYAEGANVSGIGTATVTKPRFEKCGFGVVTLPPSVMRWCGLGAGGGQFTAGSAGDYFVVDCVSMVAGSGTPNFALNGLGSTSTWNMRRFSGGTAGTLDANMTASVEVVTGGGQTWTTGGGDLEIRGIFRSANITTSGSETVQIAGLTGPIAVSGTSTATVNMYGVSSALTDTTSGATVTDATVSSTDQDAILADTNELQTDWVDGGRLDLIQDIIAADTTTDIPALIATAQADLDTITGADGALIAADAITSDKIADDAFTADHFAANALAAATFAASSLDGKGDWNTVIPATKAEMDTAHGLLATEAKQDIIDTNIDTLLTRITSTIFTGITSLAQWLGLMAGDQAADATAILEIKATGAGSGTYDEATDSQEAIAGAGGGGAPTVDQIADAVWEEAQADHTDAGTFGIIASEIAAIPTTAMRGTDGANTTTPPTASAIVNEWETQSQADPTGFHVNVLEVAGTAQTANDNGADINAILVDTGTTIPDLVTARTILAAAYATATALGTAQTDLDTLTGTDGVILATAQGNYAPSKVGDKMDLLDTIMEDV